MVTTGVNTNFLQRPATNFNKPITVHNSCQTPCFIHSPLKENEATNVSGCCCNVSFNKPATISTPVSSTECRDRSLREIQFSDLQQCGQMRYQDKTRDSKLKHEHSHGVCFTSAPYPVCNDGKPATTLSNSIQNSIFFDRRPKSSVLYRLREKIKTEKQTIKCNGDCAIAKDSLESLRNLCDKLEDTVLSPIDFAKTVHIDEFDDKNHIVDYSWMQDVEKCESKTFNGDCGFMLESSPLIRPATAPINETPRMKTRHGLYEMSSPESTPRQTTRKLFLNWYP